MKKAISIIMVLAILIGVLSFSASALSSSSQMNITSDWAFSYEHNATVAHRKSTMNINDRRYSGVLNDIDSTGLLNDSAVMRTIKAIDFNGAAADSIATINYTYTADYGTDWFRVQVVDIENDIVLADEMTSDSDSINDSISFDIPGYYHSLNIIFTYGVNGVKWVDPLAYTLEFGASVATVANPDVPDVDVNAPSSNDNFTLSHVDNSGRYWFLYSGFESGEGNVRGYDGTINTITSDGTYISGMILSGGTSFEAGRIYDRTQYTVDFASVICPMTGEYSVYVVPDSVSYENDENEEYFASGEVQLFRGSFEMDMQRTGYLDLSKYPMGDAKFKFGDTFNGAVGMTFPYETDTVIACDLINIGAAKGGNVSYENLKFYFVCTPPFGDTTIFNYDIDYNITDNSTTVNNFIEEDGGGLNINLPGLPALIIPSGNWVWDAAHFLLHLFDDEGNEIGQIELGNTNIVVNIYEGDTIVNNVYTIINEDDEGTSVDDPDDDPTNNDSGGDTGDGGGIWDWLPDIFGDALGFLLELLKSLFNAILNLVVQVITSLVDIFSSFLAGAAENITSFFGLFSADSGAFDFFNGADLTW